jgi:GNAT superfamily N-acetyltransferase
MFCETEMNPTIRKAELRDIPEIQRLYRQLDAHHTELLPEVFQPVDGDARGNELVGKWIDREDAVYLLAELNGQVVGFVNVQQASHPNYPMFRPHQFAMIENAVVDKPHRGRGIGTLLFHAAIDWARGHGLCHVQATVWHENAGAREFYLDQGFRPMTVRLELKTEGDAEPSAAGDADKPRG